MEPTKVCEQVLLKSHYHQHWLSNLQDTHCAKSGVCRSPLSSVLSVLLITLLVVAISSAVFQQLSSDNKCAN